MTATRERIERIQAEIKSLQPFFRRHAGGVCGGCDTPSEELLLDEYNDPMCFRCLGETMVHAHEKAQKRLAQLAIDLSSALTALCEEMEREKDHIGVDLDKAFREARELQYVPCPSASSKAGKTKVLGTEFNVWVTLNDPEEDL